MPTQSEIRAGVTRKIIEALEADRLPWRRPWRATANGCQPGPAQQHRLPEALSGSEPLLIELHALNLGLTSRWWGTFNQWHDIGCRVQKALPTSSPDTGDVRSFSGSR